MKVGSRGSAKGNLLSHASCVYMPRRPIANHQGDLAAPSPESRQRKFRRDFLTLRPIVVGVALRAARLSMLRPRSMASLAGRNPRQQDVTRLRARERFRMAVHTSESLMRPMIELRMRHPPKCCLCARDARQFNRDAGEFIGVTPPRGRQFDLSGQSSCEKRERVALLAG